MKTVIFACVHNAGRSQWRPVVPGIQRDDWPLEDPKGKPLARVREIRDEVKQRVQRLIEQRDWALNRGKPA
jgi:protein-tyrosine-phosphatase